MVSRDSTGKLTMTEKEKKFCLENKACLKRYDLEEAHLSKLGCCLWFKRTEDGKRDGTASPFLYAKVKAKPKTGKVFTNFHKARIARGEDAPLDLEDILGKRCDLRAHLHFECIFVNGQYVMLQVKVLEADIWPREEKEFNVIPIEEEEKEEGNTIPTLFC